MRLACSMLAVSLLGCPLEIRVEPRPDVAPTADGAPAEDGAAPSCAWGDTPTFSSVLPVAELNSKWWERQPRLTADNRTIFFVSERPLPGTQSDDFNIFVATRQQPDGPFHEPAAYSELNGPGDEGGIAVTADGLTAILSSCKGWPDTASKDWDLFIGHRPNVMTPFVPSAFTAIAGVTDASDQYDAVPSLDGRRLYYVVKDWPSGLGDQDILVGQQQGMGYRSPALVEGVNSQHADNNPTLSEDERLIVFTSSRGGDLDLYFAVRDRLDAAFSKPRPLDALNTAAWDTEPFLSADSCELYFVSRRSGGGDIYRARVTR